MIKYTHTSENLLTVTVPWMLLRMYLLYIDLMVVLNLCIMDLLGPIISYLIIQVSLCDKAASLGVTTKCVDCAGVLIFKCPC